MGGDKADMRVLPMLEGLKRGYAVVAVNYCLSREGTFLGQVLDVKAAVRWIRGHGQRYDLDPERIAAWGAQPAGTCRRCWAPPPVFRSWRT